MTAFLVQPEWPSSYDELVDVDEFTIMSRGEVVAFANEQLSLMETGAREMNEPKFQEFLQQIQAHDHALNLLILVSDRADGDWGIITVDRAAGTVSTLLEGSEFRLLY